MRQIDRSMLQYSHSSELFAVLFVYIDKEQFNKFKFVEQNSTISDRSKVETEAAREPFPVPLRQKKRWEKGETP